jgi:hypothetical protein
METKTWSWWNHLGLKKTRGVSHCGVAIYKLEEYPKAKEELWKLKCFTMQ